MFFQFLISRFNETSCCLTMKDRYCFNFYCHNLLVFNVMYLFNLQNYAFIFTLPNFLLTFCWISTKKFQIPTSCHFNVSFFPIHHPFAFCRSTSPAFCLGSKYGYGFCFLLAYPQPLLREVNSLSLAFILDLAFGCTVSWHLPFIT